MAKRKSSGNGVPMAGAKIETNPESENELREQEANADARDCSMNSGAASFRRLSLGLLKERDADPRRATLSDH
jgi:hypothetical protein